MGFTERMTNEQISQAVESTGSAPKSGVFFGEITQAEYSKSPAGAGFMKISLRDDYDESEVKFVDFCVQKRDGSDSFGMAYYHAICNMTNTQPSEPVQGKTGKYGFPSLYGKRVGIGVQVEWKDEFDNNGYQKCNKSLVSVFDYKTKQSAREMAMNLPAQKYLEPIEDKGQRKPRKKPAETDFFGNPISSTPPPTEDNLPF